MDGEMGSEIMRWMDRLMDRWMERWMERWRDEDMDGKRGREMDR